MLLNLCFLKNTNGMFYYAKGYYDRVPGFTSVMTCSSKFGPFFVAKSLHSHSLQLYAITRIYMLALIKRVFVYTPTPHPLPFLSNQLIVIHDAYPFEGLKGRLKLLLLKLSLGTSSCKVGYVNTSECLDFVKTVCPDESRRIFLPNLIEGANRSVEPALRPRNPGFTSVGLVGTDSSKKRYDLFLDLLSSDGVERLKVRIYGHKTPYISDVLAGSSFKHVSLIDCDECDLEQFLETCDIVVSIAMKEGFARPLARALTLGVPVWVVNNPVFLEFYSGAARFFATPAELVASLTRLCEDGEGLLDDITFPGPALVESMESAVRSLAAQCGEEGL